MAKLPHPFLVVAIAESLVMVACDGDSDSVREDCGSSGGRWYEGGPFPEPSCSEATADGGTPCSDNSNCEVRCQAPASFQEGELVEVGTAEHEACH